MKIFDWLLQKTGIHNYLWTQFCTEFPIRLSGETPEVQEYLKTQQKAVHDMMVYGMGCTHYVDPRNVQIEVKKPDGTVLH